MADSVEMQDIRGLDIDKTVKGFALTNYIFKNLCTVSSMSGDSVRWYQETAADLTATYPSELEISPLANFPTLEVTWTRNTSYVKKFAAEGFLSMEDIKGDDVDVLARTLLRLTRAVVKKVDTEIWNTITENQSASTINSVTVTANWDAASGQDPVEDISEALMDIEQYDYDTSNAVILLSPKDKKSLITWLTSTAGVNWTGLAGDIVKDGNIMTILGRRVIVSNNVTADYAAVMIPQKSATWKSFQDTTSRAIEDAGIGTKLRVWELGCCLLTDPRSVALISDTQA